MGLAPVPQTAQAMPMFVLNRKVQIQMMKIACKAISGYLLGKPRQEVGLLSHVEYYCFDAHAFGPG